MLTEQSAVFWNELGVSLDSMVFTPQSMNRAMHPPYDDLGVASEAYKGDYRRTYARGPYSQHRAIFFVSLFLFFRAPLTGI